MALTSEQREQIVQIRKFAADLNLSNEQKEKLRTLLDRTMEKAQTYRTINPSVPNADLRAVTSNTDQIRQQIVNFLTSEQLAKWDNAAENAKEFVVEKSAA
nr:hypothetical protein Hi04_10k_c5966_00008 [uncultured bacterium]